MRVVILRTLTWGTVSLSVASAVWLAHQQSTDPGSFRPRAAVPARSGGAFLLPTQANAVVSVPPVQAQSIETAYRPSGDWGSSTQR